MTVSVCIVTYKARDYLRECLVSLYDNTHLDFEVIVVDNNSSDGTVEMLAKEFQAVRLIQNERNEGFTLPMNQALRASRGRYILLINPDTLILPETVDRMAAFMETHKDAGICGPKVLNRDRTLQKQCRRGESRPWAAISYHLGLSSLFPKSKFFSEYLMSYMPEDQTHLVAGVSGSCMMIRQSVVDQIGYLDERFFAYQEDADFCFRARRTGWQVYYHPEAQIIHYGGLGGSRVEPYRSIIEWHRSYYLYYRKNFARDYFFLFNWLFYLAMIIRLILSLGFNLLRKEKFAGLRKP